MSILPPGAVSDLGPGVDFICVSSVVGGPSQPGDLDLVK